MHTAFCTHFQQQRVSAASLQLLHSDISSQPVYVFLDFCAMQSNEEVAVSLAQQIPQSNSTTRLHISQKNV